MEVQSVTIGEPAEGKNTGGCRKHPIRVLYSFPHKIGADRISSTAWHQVSGLVDAGAEVLVFPGVLHKPFPSGATVHPTLARGKLRIPYKLLGSKRACALHDAIVAQRLDKLVGQIDIIHTWPLGARKTLMAAARLKIPAVLERPNAHTRFAYEVVQKECERLGIALPRGHEHAHNEYVLRREDAEYRLAGRLMCPSDFVARTFLDKGFAQEKVARHHYGFDAKIYYPMVERDTSRRFTALFAGGCAPRKGLHFALEAWLRSPAHLDGTFLIAGGFIPGYAEGLSPMLAHPSIQVLGHRNDIPELMRRSDVLILPSIEEGSALVTSEARGSGCVLLVSEATGAICTHMENALVHQVGNVDMLTQHIGMLYEDSQLLEKLRTASLSSAGEITWDAAGRDLLDVYRNVIRSYASTP